MLIDPTITRSQVINFIFSRKITPNEPRSNGRQLLQTMLFIPHLPGNRNSTAKGLCLNCHNHIFHVLAKTHLFCQTLIFTGHTIKKRKVLSVTISQYKDFSICSV